MKSTWIVLGLAMAASLGCQNSPKREMRPPKTEEFAIPPERLNTPPDVPSDAPALTPKQTGIGPGAGPGMASPTGAGPGGTPGGVRR